MKSRWTKIGNFPNVSYLDKNGYGLTLQFFEGTGDVFVSFTNPPEAMIRAASYAMTCEAEKGSPIQCLLLDNFYMGRENVVKHTIEAIFAYSDFEDSIKQEVRQAVNAHYAGHNKTHARIGLFEPVPVTPLLQAQFDAIEKANTPWYKRR